MQLVSRYWFGAFLIPLAIVVVPAVWTGPADSGIGNSQGPTSDLPTLAIPSGGFEYGTPEACYQAIQAAAARRNYALLYDSATPETQTMLAGSLAVVGSMLREFGGWGATGGGASTQQMQSAIRQIDALIVQQQIHQQTLAASQTAIFQSGGDPNQLMAIFHSVTTSMRNPRSFVVQMMPLLESLDRAPKGPVQQLRGRLEQMQQEGEWVTATVRDASGDVSTIYFKRTPLGWRFHLDPRAVAGPARQT